MTNVKGMQQSVLQLSWPIFIELLLQIMVGSIDQIMLSRYADEAVAAVANANQVMNVFLFFMTVLSTATTILLAQYWGADNREKIIEVCNTSLFFNAFLGAIIGGLLFLGKEAVFLWMEVPAELWEQALLYLTFGCVGFFIQGMYFSLVAIFRGFSRMQTTMTVALAMNLVHIATNSVLIFGWGPLPELGVTGVAISTLLAKGGGFLVLLYLCRKYLAIPISWRYLRPLPQGTIKRLLYLGVPAGGEDLSYQLSQMAIMKMVNVYGLLVITTKVYVTLLAVLSYMYSLALSAATQIVIGYLMGAARKDEVTAKGWQVVLISVAVGGGISSGIYMFSDEVLGLLTNDPLILALGKEVLLIDIFLEIFRGVNIALVRCLQATGDVRMPTITGIVCMWLVAVGGAYLFGIHWGWGLVGIWLGMTLDEAIRAGIFIWRWHSGVWKAREMI